jgi:4-nitrophenyl phosphatase
MDGVIYRGEQPMDDAASTLDSLKNAGRTVTFLTNNSGSTREDYLKKLARMGIHVSLDQIFTSAYATALYLKPLGAEGKTVFVVGHSGIVDELSAIGMNVLTKPDEAPADQVDYVVAGIDRAFTYDKLKYAHRCILEGGAQFIATNRDATFPVETGTVPGAGSIIASIATATGQEPIVIGKPESHAVEKILSVTGSQISETLMVGDRLDTDIAAGNRLGIKTALVLTGVSTREEAENAPSELKPSLIIGSLAELLEGIK